MKHMYKQHTLMHTVVSNPQKSMSISCAGACVFLKLWSPWQQQTGRMSSYLPVTTSTTVHSG